MSASSFVSELKTELTEASKPKSTESHEELAKKAHAASDHANTVSKVAFDSGSIANHTQARDLHKEAEKAHKQAMKAYDRHLETAKVPGKFDNVSADKRWYHHRLAGHHNHHAAVHNHIAVVRPTEKH